MSDRLKFRVWDTWHNKYLNDDYPYYLDTEGVLYEGASNVPPMQLEKCVVEQCTGLRDKNGKLIYEGDVLQLGSRIRKVEFDCGVKLTTSEKIPVFTVFTKAFDLFIRNCEIIGNIHEEATNG